MAETATASFAPNQRSHLAVTVESGGVVFYSSPSAQSVFKKNIIYGLEIHRCGSFKNCAEGIFWRYKICAQGTFLHFKNCAQGIFLINYLHNQKIYNTFAA